MDESLGVKHPAGGVPMIKAKKYEGVIEAVHYAPDGNIDWVRGYERRGFIFTDMLLFSRQTLLSRLQEGERFYVGSRKPHMGNDFVLHEALRLEGKKGGEHVVAGKSQGKGDFLEGAPVF